MNIKKHNTLLSYNDIKQFFKNYTQPLFYIGYENYNLIALNDWVPSLHYVTLLDSFNNQYKNNYYIKFKPMPYFSDIADINNFLLMQPQNIQYMKSKTEKPKILALMFDSITEDIAKYYDMELLFPKSSMREKFDSKIGTTKLANKAFVLSVPNILSNIKSYSHLRKISKHLGEELVIQTAYGDSGTTTYFVSNELDFDKIKETLISAGVVKIMKKISCSEICVEGCATRSGTFCGPVMTSLVGAPELTSYKGGWCGNDIFFDDKMSQYQKVANDFVVKIGDELYRQGYKGTFELDLLVDNDTNEVYLGELNPRLSGVSILTNQFLSEQNPIPLFLFHLLEFLDIDFEIDAKKWNDGLLNKENAQEYCQILVKNLTNEMVAVTKFPKGGVWKFDGENDICYDRFDYRLNSLKDETEAIFIPIVNDSSCLVVGDYLGMVLFKGRGIDKNGDMNSLNKLWLNMFSNQIEYQEISKYFKI